MLFDESAIKVLLSYTPGDSKDRFGSVKLMPSGQGRGSSFNCPGTDASNVEQVCDEVIDAIQRAASNPSTAEKDKFKFMGLVLEDQARVVWQQSAQAIQVDPLNPNAGDFHSVVKEFFNKRTHTSKMRDNILRYLEMLIKKPRTWDPLKYESRFNKILKNAEYFNGIKPDPTAAELKDWYLRSYPKAYKADYLKKGTFLTDDIADITKHMMYLHTIDEAKGLLEEDSAKKSSKRKERKSSRRSRGSGRSSSSRYYRDNGNRDSRRSSSSKYRSRDKDFEVPPDTKCLVHPDGKHTWSECSLNPENAKDKDSQKHDRKDRKREDKQGKKYASHHVDHSDDEASRSREFDREDGESSSSTEQRNESESDSDSSAGHDSKRRAASHHTNGGINSNMEKLQVVDGFEDE